MRTQDEADCAMCDLMEAAVDGDLLLATKAVSTLAVCAEAGIIPRVDYFDLMEHGAEHSEKSKKTMEERQKNMTFYEPRPHRLRRKFRREKET